MKNFAWCLPLYIYLYKFERITIIILEEKKRILLAEVFVQTREILRHNVCQSSSIKDKIPQWQNHRGSNPRPPDSHFSALSTTLNCFQGYCRQCRIEIYALSPTHIDSFTHVAGTAYLCLRVIRVIAATLSPCPSNTGLWVTILTTDMFGWINGVYTTALGVSSSNTLIDHL